jgi:hypothetical protein
VSAATEYICIDKKSGVVRVASECKSTESKGTRKITAPKLTKVEQLQKQVNDLRAGKIRLENERDKYFQDLQLQHNGVTINSEDALLKAKNDCKPTPDTEPCRYIISAWGLGGSWDKQYATIIRVLNKAELSLQKELKGYKTLRCIKGNEVLEITDLKPKCPKGYRLKV